MFTQRKILVVEDNEINRMMLSAILSSEYEVLEAENGQAALAVLRKYRDGMFAASFTGYYDLIFMDIQMPHMDGYQATRRIRAMERSDAASIPIVAMTANAFTEDIKLALEAGMNQHMAKPIDIRQLETIMFRWLG